MDDVYKLGFPESRLAFIMRGDNQMVTLNHMAWSRLSGPEKQQMLQERLPKGFSFCRLERFERYGQSLETGVCAYEGVEFVFVPGNEVTLGWDGWSGEPDSTASRIMEESFSLIGVASKKVEERLRGIMTPVRNAVIQPILVERNTQSVGWTEVAARELDAERHAELFERLDTFKNNSNGNREYYPSYRLDRDGEQIRIYLFNESEDFEEWADYTLNRGFDIPTEDEWEYLYGAGCRTLFPWGNGMNDSMHLEPPNAFGLYFLGDPYQKELTRTADGGSIGKGGDGMVIQSGGQGEFFSYLTTAVYYHDHHEDEQEWLDWLDQLHYRRIVRL